MWNTYDILSFVRIFPKYKYISLMQHIQEKIWLKAVRLCNVTIAGHKRKNISVYELGGKDIKGLFK